MATPAAPATATKIQWGGGSLFALAAKVYGDATQWNRIAQANGMVDPWQFGIFTLSLPPVVSSTSGGIYGR